MSVFELPPAYPALLPPGPVGEHRPAGTCPFCGVDLQGRTKCPGCATSLAVDCRPRSETVECGAEECSRRGTPGLDIHELYDGFELLFRCAEHCWECEP